MYTVKLTVGFTLACPKHPGSKGKNPRASCACPDMRRHITAINEWMRNTEAAAQSFRAQAEGDGLAVDHVFHAGAK